MSSLGKVIRQKSFVGVASVTLTNPSLRNYLCLLYDALSWARVMFGVTDALLIISYWMMLNSL